MKVLELRFLDKEHSAFFKGKYRKHFKPGVMTREDDIPGLQMSLNEMSGMISIDAPGDSIGLHISVCAPVFPPTIDAVEYAHREAARVEADTQKAPKAKDIANVATPKKTKAELDAALGFDSEGDDLDDKEIAKLLQGSGAKKAVATRTKKKPGPKPKAKPAPVPASENDWTTGKHDDETDDDA